MVLVNEFCKLYSQIGWNNNDVIGGLHPGSELLEVVLIKQIKVAVAMQGLLNAIDIVFIEFREHIEIVDVKCEFL